MVQIVTGQDGTRHEFPDEATPEMIGQALGLKPPAPPDKRPFANTSLGKAYYGFSDAVDQGLSFNLADEVKAAGAGVGSMLKGEGFSKGYDDALATQRQSMKETPAYLSIPGQVIGSLATGGGVLARGGATLLAGAQPTVANMALRGAGEGALYGLGYGFGAGEGGFENRAENAAKGGAVGAITGGATGAIAGAAARANARAAIPTTEQLHQQGTRAYDAVENAGVTLDPARYRDVVNRIGRLAYKEGYHPDLQKGITTALSALDDAAQSGQPLSLSQLDTLRKVVAAAGESDKASERRLAALMVDEIDGFVRNLSPRDVVSGDPASGALLDQARGLWSRMRKAETIDGAIDVAEATARTTGQSYGDVLRREFLKLWKNDAAMRGFTDEERDAVRAVAEGGAIENAIRLAGRFAPRGVVSGGFGLGVAATGGPVAGAAIAGAGEGARRTASAMTNQNALGVSDMVRAGAAAPANTNALLGPGQRALVGAAIPAEAEVVPQPFYRNSLSQLLY